MTVPVISLLCPTRGRDGARQLYETAIATANRPDAVELVRYVDFDDPAPPDGDQLPRCLTIRGPRILLSECWNRCAERSSAEILGHMGDDIRFRTAGWDERIRETFELYPDRICFVHGRDGLHDGALGTHGFVHRRWVEAIGYFVPPRFSSDFNDVWLTEIADMIDRRAYLPDVYTEHMHPAVGKSKLDRTHRERVKRGKRDNVDALYESLAPERTRDADKLRAVLS